MSSLSPSKVAVVGSGSFGSAMVRVVSQALQQAQNETLSGENPHKISWYARRQSIVDEINTQKTNQQYLDGMVFDKAVEATSNLDECVRDASVVILAVPSAYLPPLLQELSNSLDKEAVVCSVLKSLHYNPETRQMTTAGDDIQQMLPNHPVTCLVGPNLYKEMIAEHEFAEATVGYHGDQKWAALKVQEVTSSTSFQTSLQPDRVGLEWCGGLKNVLSLAAGYTEGLDLGWNCKSALIRAGMHEMARLMQRHPSIHNPHRTVFETSGGVGDLILTCTAGRGRLLAAQFVKEGLANGRLVSKSKSVQRWHDLESSLLNGMKLPDWHNAQQVHQALSDWECLEDFPLLRAVYQIGFQGEDPRFIVQALGESIRLADQERDL